MKKWLHENNMSLRWKRAEPTTFLHPTDIPLAIAQVSIVDGQHLTFAECDTRKWDVYSKFAKSRKAFDLDSTYIASVKVKPKGDRNG